MAKAKRKAVQSPPWAEANRSAALHRLKELKLDKHIGDALDATGLFVLQRTD